MLPQFKTIVALNNVSYTAGQTSPTGLIDTLGYDWATIDVISATSNVVSNVPTVLKLQEADVTAASSFADIAAFATPASFPNANTAATAVLQNNFKFNVNCASGARKRYLQVVFAPATTQVTTVIANMGRGEIAPTTAAKANAMTLTEG